MKTYDLTIEALDGKVLSERTGKTTAKAVCHNIPSKEGTAMFLLFYKEGEAIHPTNPSPGLAIPVAMVENIGNEYRITDEEGRKFRVIMEESNG